MYLLFTLDSSGGFSTFFFRESPEKYYAFQRYCVPIIKKEIILVFIFKLYKLYKSLGVPDPMDLPPAHKSALTNGLTNIGTYLILIHHSYFTV